MLPTSSPEERIFNRLYLSTRNGLFHYLNRYSRDVHWIEDIMQQCYVKVWERLDAIKDPEFAIPLLKTYARNLMIDEVRRRMKEDARWLDQVTQEVNQIIETQIGPEDRIRLQLLDKAIDRLPDSCRQVYLLHREGDLSYKEISSRLSISVSMVEKHMSKAIRLLKNDVLTNPSLLLALLVGYDSFKL